MVTPPCHNRPPRQAGTLEPTGRMRVNLFARWPEPQVKPILRWRPSPFVDRCATHDGVGIGPNNESYPQAHGWNCAGCRWLPTHLSRHYRHTQEQLGVLQERWDRMLLDAVAPLLGGERPAP